MSSGFVSGGTIDNPAERDDAWRKAQDELAENRRRKDEEAQRSDGKSLFEVLEANKAAKQEAFEESIRLKNQYRALDDDEAEFLAEVLENTRKKEAAVKKDTLEQLEVFRRQQEEAERKALEEANAGGPPVEDAPLWVAGARKRKKTEKDGGLLKGVKLRKASSSADAGTEGKKVGEEQARGKQPAKELHSSTSPSPATASTPDTKSIDQKVEGCPKKTSPAKASTSSVAVSQATKTPLLGLGYASSDEED